MMIPFICRPTLMDRWDWWSDEEGVQDWIEVVCEAHEYVCGHRHRRWGPISRCMARHVEGHSDE